MARRRVRARTGRGAQGERGAEAGERRARRVVPCPAGERALDRADDQAADGVGLAETQLGFGGVDVDVELVGREVEPDCGDGEAAVGDDVAVGHA